MARRWIVLTAARAPHAVYEIIAYTEWDGYAAAADEVVYTDPEDADGNAVDALWKVSGTVTLAAGVYTYLDPGTEPTLANRQRAQIFSAYLYWRVFGRTGHWAGLRVHLTEKTDALDACDKWAVHIVALVDQAIHGVFPITGAYTPEQLQAFVDHCAFVLRNLGPAWYLEQFTDDTNVPTGFSHNYRDLLVVAGTAIYSDVATLQGVLRAVDGMFLVMGVSIRAGFNPEDRLLGN